MSKGMAASTKEKASSTKLTSNVEVLEERRASLPLAQLNANEERFFELVEKGDVAAVQSFINTNRTLNVNCVNYKGLNAMHIALKREDEAMVRVFFGRPDLEVRDSALHAVATGNTDLTATVLDLINKMSPGGEFKGGEDSTVYSSDITPLSLAAQNGDYKMVRMLLARGHEVEKPHAPNCLCPKCKSILREHGAALSRIRLNSYSAICNPCYICQVTDDPILYAFLLDGELNQSALMDKEFRAEYGDLAAEVRGFTVDLLSQCRNTAEVELLLKLPEGFDLRSHKTNFPRLQLALDHKQKEFVANSMVQQVLTAHWLGEFRSWPRLPLGMKVLQVLARVILLPVICMLLLVVPWLRQLKKYHSPLNRFLLSLASYSLFLLYVLMVNILDTGRYKRGAPNTGFEGLVVIFVIGHVWATIRQVWVAGYKRFFKAPWNWYDICMETFFVLSFLFWIFSVMEVLNDQMFKRKVLERKFWNSYDATLVHEALFAVATVLACGKLAYYCLQSSRLGPLQVSMGKMAVHIGYFLILCFLINTSFAVPLTRMYAYYDGMKQTDADGNSKSQLSTFTSFSNSFSTLFWGMFGMSPAEAADVVIQNLSDDLKNPVINTHDFTQSVGRALFATYELLMIIALVNTLIAILSNTFQKVVDNADVEFKFHRTMLWMKFFDESTLVPSPFNLIPSLTLLQKIGIYCKAMGNKIPGGKAKFSMQRCCYVEYETTIDTEVYETLMSNLVQRYFKSKEADE